jgi:hypothetical protein
MCLGMKTEMIIFDFQESFSSIFWFLGLNGNGSANRKYKNDNGKNNRKRKQIFLRLPYLADNLPLVVIDSKALNHNLFTTHKHIKANIFFERNTTNTNRLWGSEHPHLSARRAPTSMQVGVNCVVSSVVLARGLVNCDFIYYCHMR